tara:strand:+ start:1569 stop:1808 length:240 start_codon:yes stop_codon:yes gene_type:complete
MTADKQRKARERNWLKAQLINCRGVLRRHRESGIMATHEATTAAIASACIDDILETWDESSEMLGFTPRTKEKENQDDN